MLKRTNRRVATCKPGKPGLTSYSETLALVFIQFLSFRKMKVQDRQNVNPGLPEKTGWLRAWLKYISTLILVSRYECGPGKSENISKSLLKPGGIRTGHINVALHYFTELQVGFFLAWRCSNSHFLFTLQKMHFSQRVKPTQLLSKWVILLNRTSKPNTYIWVSGFTPHFE